MKRKITEAIMEVNHTANQFKSSIVLLVQGKSIDVKSMLGLSITLFHDDEFKMEIHGPDEQEAKHAMQTVFAKNGLVVEFI
ncbi:HPr family phosphocarrier protein [Paenibacillus illinoisensis]|uniref:HPr family phosphocarrier protein n=1 Tax=Paenibacillus illinoisensis TaxID=59845 RepID=UPI003D2E48D8